MQLQYASDTFLSFNDQPDFGGLFSNHNPGQEILFSMNYLRPLHGFQLQTLELV